MILTSNTLIKATENITNYDVANFLESDDNKELVKSLIVLQRMDKNNEDIDNWNCALCPLIFR